MITKDNFQAVLEVLNFNESNRSYSKYFAKLDCTLTADFNTQTLIYPDSLVINEKQTCNFSANENFVVFECVHRLLEKGYQPEHIELEPRWKLGHSDKSGRADIWIRTKKGGEKHSLLIIECKTAGKEYNDAWADTQEDGAQLFSYFQQERATKFLCLYSSDFADDAVKSEYHLINAQDNTEYIATLKDPKTYAKAHNNKQLFAVWKKTYQQDVARRGLFETDIAAYHIGKNKYSIHDLVEVDNEAIQKKYHEFATILRQHNVSGHENAFDKLVNLFLAKVVDETNNPEELAFYWKGAAYDDAFRLQDRLQKLYKIGMGKFLGEEVTYIENQDIENAFHLFKNKPDETKKTVLDYFRQLKFFTNNDFAFIDVHNEKLFNQNAVVLRKIVLMLQDIKLKTDTQNQFLGDLFEGFLDQGVKQSEGQFFTPMPIVKFLISSLPLEKIITESADIPKAIDYACGAGHFLNEYAGQIKPFIEKHKTNELKHYYAAITGIEKEYRLSKVAKVSAFMYGQDDVNIIYADALAQHENVSDGQYSVLVANPPYSVKGFLETLAEEDRARFSLNQEVSDRNKNNAIETFFVERAAQLLKNGGVAAIVLPSSILSNGNIYIKCREILLKYFDIVAIAELGSGTFGKTGTNTATLFLRRKAGKPDLAAHYQNRVNAWFDTDRSADGIFEDHQLLTRYCAHIGVAAEDYNTLFNRAMSDKLQAHEIFAEYRKIFAGDTKAKNIKKKRITANYTAEEQAAELEKHILQSICTIEKEKLYYFMLAMINPQPVLIVKSPADSKAVKQFLGYEWSGAKGNEGIKYIGVNLAATTEDDEDNIANLKGINQIKTPLFNPNDLADDSKINALIRANFEGKTISIPEALSGFISAVRLTDMLDFSRVTFDKALRTSAVKKVEISSKYPLVKLGEVAEIIRGVTYAKPDQVGERTSKVILTADNITLDGQFVVSKEIFLRETKELDDLKRLRKNDCFMCFSSGSKNHVGKICYIYEDLNYYAGGFMGILRTKNKIEAKFMYNMLNTNSLRGAVRNLSSGTNIQNLSNSIGELKIPLPPLDIQQKIIKECEAVDAEYNSSRMSIENYKQKIVKVFEDLEVIIHKGGVIGLKSTSYVLFLHCVLNILIRLAKILSAPKTYYKTVRA